MKTFIGIDAVDIKRIQQARQFERLSEFILHPAERATMDASRDRYQFLASRLAIKEAVIKAFPFPLSLQDIHTLGYGGKPQVQVQHPQAGEYQIDVGLTHTFELAVGVALVVSS